MIQSRRMRWPGQVAQLEKRNAFRLFVEKPEGKRLQGRLKLRW
jgi:hypothetical protein